MALGMRVAVELERTQVDEFEIELDAAEAAEWATANIQERWYLVADKALAEAAEEGWSEAVVVEGPTVLTAIEVHDDDREGD